MRKGLAVEVLTADGIDTATVLAWGEKGATVELSKGLRGGIPYEQILVTKPFKVPKSTGEVPKSKTRTGEKLQQNQGSNFSSAAKPQITSLEDVHLAADARAIPWDNDPDFMIWCG